MPRAGATPGDLSAGARVILAVLALFFVILGATNLDLGPAEARLGLAAGEKLGPLGQVFGYWAPDLWPAQVVPSHLARAPGGLSAGPARRPYAGPPHWRGSSRDG